MYGVKRGEISMRLWEYGVNGSMPVSKTEGEGSNPSVPAYSFIIKENL